MGDNRLMVRLNKHTQHVTHSDGLNVTHSDGLNVTHSDGLNVTHSDGLNVTHSDGLNVTLQDQGGSYSSLPRSDVNHSTPSPEPETDDENYPASSKTVDLFAVAGATRSSSPSIETMEDKATNRQKRHRWKNFKEDVRKATSFMKAKVTPKRRRKNEVTQISLKPDGICQETGKQECWTTKRESWPSHHTRQTPERNSPDVDEQRTGSGRSITSSKSVSDIEDIETIYDAKYEGH